MDFFERVKVAAKAQGTTIEYLAGKAGLTRGAWNTYRRRGLLPRADEATVVARELKSTVEYLVDGKEPAALGANELALLARARRWAPILDDLEALDPAGQHGFAVALHANAQEARALRESQAKASS